MCGVGLCVVCRGDVCVSSCLAPKTLPSVRSKRSRVYFSKRPCHKGHGRFERTHESVFNVHTGASLSLLSCLPLSCSRVFLSLSFSSLSVTMTMITRPVGSLRTHNFDLPQGPECKGRGPFPVGLTCSHHARNNCLGASCASLVPLGMKWACICAGSGCCVWRC